MPNEYYPSKQELVEHIQTLNGLIDGQDDQLGQMLTPIVAMMEKMVAPLWPTLTDNHVHSRRR